MNPVPCPRIVVYPSDIDGHLLDYPGWLSVYSLGSDVVEVEICCASNLGDAEVVFGRSLPEECEQPFVELHLSLSAARALAAELLRQAARADTASPESEVSQRKGA